MNGRTCCRCRPVFRTPRASLSGPGRTSARRRAERHSESVPPAPGGRTNRSRRDRAAPGRDPRPRPVGLAVPARRGSGRLRPGSGRVPRQPSSAPLAAGHIPHAAHRPWRRVAAPDRIQAAPVPARPCSCRRRRPAREGERPGCRHPARRVAGSNVGSLPALRSARTAAVAACRSAFAVSTAACFSETATRYGSLSSSARSAPLCTRLLSSTRTREICPATRGATNVTCPFTNASSVETVWSISSTHGIPNTRRTARTTTPSTPARSVRFRVVVFASWAAEASVSAVGCASIEPGSLLCSVMSGTRCKCDEYGRREKTTTRADRQDTSAAAFPRARRRNVPTAPVIARSEATKQSPRRLLRCARNDTGASLAFAVRVNCGPIRTSLIVARGSRTKMRDWAPIAVPLFATRLRDFQRSNANPLSVVGVQGAGRPTSTLLSRPESRQAHRCKRDGNPLLEWSVIAANQQRGFALAPTS